MCRKIVLFLFFVATSVFAQAQKPAKKAAVDSLAYYDDLFNELESFFDSLTAPRSFATINLGISNNFFNYQRGSTTTMQASRQLVFTPSFIYMHKSGLGFGTNASVINESNTFNMYQVATSASYDYLKNRNFMSGISFTHYFTKDSLKFYTSPLSNEVYAYFSYRKWWLKPAVAATYGWGSRTNVEEREEIIKKLKKKTITSTVTTETIESVYDLTVTASVKHDFLWLDVLTSKDYVRVTPQISFTGGTQRFGFNQTNNTLVTNTNNKNISTSFNTENIKLSEVSEFMPLALSARLRSEFSKGKFFIQPQMMLDYYFPAKENHFSTSFAVNTGLTF